MLRQLCSKSALSAHMTPKHRNLKMLCIEFVVDHRDLFKKEVEELPLTLKANVKNQWNSLN